MEYIKILSKYYHLLKLIIHEKFISLINQSQSSKKSVYRKVHISGHNVHVSQNLQDTGQLIEDKKGSNNSNKHCSSSTKHL